ncbi:hypothetical protein QQS21_001594 [Conoideocrella luteorostrata]|uniref:Uncharacterized protein n=1 Tax=Conoideocrella luteorostrata TaxID=1105319 RepID=A0AAJ0G1R1_9HYPO|nr:hypothetical protein QQS21_001594 [Conoideocrella luteorostrata]
MEGQRAYMRMLSLAEDIGGNDKQPTTPATPRILAPPLQNTSQEASKSQDWLSQDALFIWDIPIEYEGNIDSYIARQEQEEAGILELLRELSQPIQIAE